MEIDRNKLHTIRQVAEYINEPVYSVRMWLKEYNIKPVQRALYSRNYLRYSQIEKLIRIKILFRELYLTHQGVKIIMNKVKEIDDLENELKEKI